ncbi:hypothetical protein C7999DRAFT_18031, partial [Corynascus novoguineensis]
SRIKRDEIGEFDPSFSDPQYLGIVKDGKNLVFTDAYCFIDRVEGFWERDITGRVEAQLLDCFQTF